MITINLLPPEELKSLQFSQKRIPVIPCMVAFFLILFLYWVFVVFTLTHLKMQVARVHKNVAQIAGKKSDVDIVWEELHNKLIPQKRFIEDNIQSEIEWARVLNAVSNFASQGVWLYKLDLEKKDAVWFLSLKGFAKPVTSRSMIKDIGNYTTMVKETIETHMKRNVSKPEEKKEFIEVTTTTKRKKAKTIELTEFSTTFKINA